MRSLISCLMLSLAASSSFAATASTGCDDEARFKEIDKKELQALIPKAEAHQAAIIDVNSAESFQKAKVPGAVHFDAVKAKLAQALPADKAAPVVAYCGGPKCEAWRKAAKEACALGYTNIRHYKGGISGWLSSK